MSLFLLLFLWKKFLPSNSFNKVQTTLVIFLSLFLKIIEASEVVVDFQCVQEIVINFLLFAIFAKDSG
ncbi:hypothetical protein GW891_02590 [bacterium]|nr:hypothetical protein [bacterium]